MPQQPDDQFDPRDDRPGPTGPSDSAAIDRVFAELVADFDDSPDPAQRPASPASPDVIDDTGAGSADGEAGPTPPAGNEPPDADRAGISPAPTTDGGPDPDELLAELERQFAAPQDRPAPDTGEPSWRQYRRPSATGGVAHEPAPPGWRSPTGSVPSADDPDAWDLDDDADPDEGKPQPPPWPRLSAPALIGWLGILLAIATMVVAAVGVTLPYWAGWAAVAAFVGGFGLLLSRLPRHRPPDAGDGACL